MFHEVVSYMLGDSNLLIYTGSEARDLLEIVEARHKNSSTILVHNSRQPDGMGKLEKALWLMQS